MHVLIESLSHNEICLPVFGQLNRFPENCFFSWMGLWSFLFAVAAIVLAIGVAFIIDKRHKWFEQLANKYLTPAFIVVWLFGFVVYDIGMYTGEPWSLLGNVPMAILHAFGIFILNSDVSEIQDAFHTNGWFMFGFSSVHFLAALVSLVFVLKHFGFSIIAAIKRKFFLSSKETTFIFWGMNDATYSLAKSVNQKFARDGGCRVVVVRTNHETDTAVVKNGMERLLNFLSLKNNDLERLKELDCIAMSTYSNLATIETQPKDTTYPTQPIDILQKKLRLKSLSTIIQKKTTETIHLFFLEDDEETNIQAIANLIHDTYIQDFAKRGKVKFYCHARYNSVHRVIEDELTHKNIEVKVVDSSHISVELLKQNPELHPVNYVRVEDDATVSSDFNALVIGFGEVGLDAVRFLYEFGAFVKSETGKVERSNFCCHVVDSRMNDLAGQLTINSPSIIVSSNRTEDDDPKKMINLYNMDCRSLQFYKWLDNWIKTLNYVVIATDDDETNVSMAVRIFRLAIRNREDNLSGLRILVRVKHDENGHYQNIAYHYNRLWAAELESVGDKLYQNKVDVSRKADSPITIFGLSEKVYAYEPVINESLKTKAKNFKDKYDRSMNEMKRLANIPTDEIEDWDEEQNRLMQLTGENKGYSPTYSGMMRLRRVQSQNFANSLHEGTKRLLVQKALLEEYKNIESNGLIRNVGTCTYRWLNDSKLPIKKYQKVLDTLAQTEHLRWNASHEILGYRDDMDEDSKNEAKLIHGCLKTWDELSEMKRIYDYDVVDVSLGLINIE